MISKVKSLFLKIINLYLVKNLDENKKISAQIMVRYNRDNVFNNISDAEFKVFSQFGEDGIIQYLVNKIPIKNRVFIEFGVEHYEEANTRFLLENDNWSGLVMDGSKENVQKIKKSDSYWMYDLVAKDLFINRDNIDDAINNYIKESDFESEIGLLSIDIDGNDYYVWEAIKSIEPVIVICEYNSLFGNKVNVSVPYDKNFIRTQQHYSNLYFGASIQALYELAQKKGYEYIGCTKAGNDAFFVKKDYAKRYIKELITTPNIQFNEIKARQSRDENGELTYLRGKDNIKIIESMKVFDFENNKITKLSEIVK
jgi:hypothetical protein